MKRIEKPLPRKSAGETCDLCRKEVPAGQPLWFNPATGNYSGECCNQNS